MKFFSELIHKTPWWFLIGGGLVTLAALAIFVTPFQLIRLEKSAATSDQKRAIQREIDFAFSEGAIDVARGIVKELRAHTKDPQRRAELDQALAEIDEARNELREAGRDVARAKREAAQEVTNTVREVTRNITDAQREATRVLKEAGIDDKEVVKALEESIRRAKEAEAKARQDAEKNANERVAEAQRRLDEARARAEEQRRIIMGKAEKAPKVNPPALPSGAEIPVPPVSPVPPLPPLSPEMRDDIHKRVTGDLRRIGVGAGLILLFIPLFILAVVSKVFIDRSRVSLRVAEDKRREAEYHRMTQQVTEAKLQALQAQVEPHFLYNTLASVQALTEVDPARANEMTGHLIQYLRNALPKMRESVSTVGQEVELVRAYLSILQMRMGERLAFTIEVPDALMALPFPPLMLPSLVENAIKHGLEPQREGGVVHITASEEGGRLRLVVSDTGRGFSETPGAGVGLANIRERLAALYGGAARFTLEANTPRGVVATIEVPAQGTRSQAAAGAGASTSAPPVPPVPPPPPAPELPASVVAAPPGAFWPRAWEVMVKLERGWRITLYYVFLMMVGVAAIAAVVLFVGASAGFFPIMFGDDMVTGPASVLLAFAASVIAFLAVTLALAIVTLVFYGLGFFLFALAIFVACVVLIGLSPVLAPFVLIGIGIWYMARKRKAAAAAPAPAQRVEPTMAE